MSLKVLAKQTAIYGVSTIVLRLASWLLAPYYSRVIEKVDIGINGDLLAMAAFINVIYMMGMETSYFRFIKNLDEKEIFKKANSIVFYNSLFWSILFFLFASPIVNLLHYPGKEIYVYLLATILFCENLCNVPFARLRHHNKAFSFIRLKGLFIFLNIGLNIFFLSFLLTGKVSLPFSVSKDPVVLIFLANLIPWLLIFLYFLKDIAKLESPLSTFKSKDIYKYSLPLIIVGAAGMVNETFDRPMLKYLLPGTTKENLAELGVYNTNYKLSIVMTLVIQGFRMGAEPYFFKESSKKDAKATYAIIMDFFVVICCCIMVLGSINRELLSIINHHSFKDGVKILPYLLLANLFLGMYYNSSVWYKLTDNTMKGAWISIIGATITVIFNWILIPILGYEGAAITTLICYFSMLMISFVWGQRVFPIPYQFGRIFLWVGFSIIYSTFAFYYFQSNTFLLLVFSFVFLIFGLVYLYKQFSKIKLGDA